jgi:hypothetical protein
MFASLSLSLLSVIIRFSLTQIRKIPEGLGERFAVHERHDEEDIRERTVSDW